MTDAELAFLIELMKTKQVFWSPTPNVSHLIQEISEHPDDDKHDMLIFFGHGSHMFQEDAIDRARRMEGNSASSNLFINKFLEIKVVPVNEDGDRLPPVYHSRFGNSEWTILTQPETTA